MSYLYGTESRVYGIQGNIALNAAGGTEWAALTGTAKCVITGYTYTPSMVGNVEGYDQYGALVCEAFAGAQFEMSLTFEFGSTKTTGGAGGGEEDARQLIMPNLMAKIKLENMDNTDLNGIYNFRTGSVTGSNQGWKVGNMTLRAVDNGLTINSSDKVAMNLVGQ
jgi:hypothetical protein